MSLQRKLTLAVLACLCGTGFPARPTFGQAICYVDEDGEAGADCGTWESACPELQTALHLASPGDQIWVAAGSYRPDYDIEAEQHTGDREATFRLVNGVAIYGGFDGTESSIKNRAGLFEQTVLTGDLAGDDDYNDFPLGLTYVDNSHHVVSGSGTDASAIIDGFLITAGSADGAYPNNVGAGMLNLRGSPTVRRCSFTSNATSFAGGGNGAGMYNRNSSPTVTHCTFSGNCSGGNGAGLFNSGGDPIVTHSTFSWNSATGSGGGVCNASSNLTLAFCLLDHNMSGYDGAAMFNLASDLTVSHCLVTTNKAGGAGGGIFNNDSGPNVINCIFSGNTAAGQGGGVYHATSNPRLVNCTFCGNSAQRDGGGMCNETSNPAVSNSIFWANTDEGGTDESAQIHDLEYSRSHVDYSLIQGLEVFTAAGNIDAHPLFFDPDGPDDNPQTFIDNDYRLTSGSPCVDAGDNTAVPGDLLDLDGDGDLSEPVSLDLEGQERFFDDPDTNDTGFGLPPLTDLGPYELQGSLAPGLGPVGRVDE